MSNNSQKLPVGVDDCARIATHTLEREGYQPGGAGNNWVSGQREIHRALIICDPSPDGTWVNVVVSSSSMDFNASGYQQRLLMSRIAEIARDQRFDDHDRDRDANREHDRDRDADRDSDHDRDRDANRDGARWFTMTWQQPLPPNPFAAGQEPNHPVPQYVCRALHEGSMIPGKTVTAGTTDCLIAYHNVEVRKITFDVLTGDAGDYVWALPNAGRPPLVTGNQGTTQFRSCRYELFVRNANKGLQVGREEAGKCIVGYKGLAYTSDQYEVLALNR